MSSLSMDALKSLPVRAVGFPATLIHGDTLVLDRWRWLRDHLQPGNGRRLIDVGCGTGAFTIGAARLGYSALGLSWDSRNQETAARRAAMCGARTAEFQVLDVRRMDDRPDLTSQFEVAICLETIEHILDDRKLLRDIARTLKPGGRLLLTTPFIGYRAITKGDDGPFSTYEDGWHVRRGYDANGLRSIAEAAGFRVTEISFVSGFLSQKITGLLRTMGRANHYLSWGITLPLRVLPPVLDEPLTNLLRWPKYSIAIDATKVLPE